MDSESNHNVGSEFNPFDYAQPTPPAHATQSPPMNHPPLQPEATYMSPSVPSNTSHFLDTFHDVAHPATHAAYGEYNPFDYGQPTPPAHATQSQGSPYHSTMAPPAAAQPKRKKVSSTKRGKKKVNTPPATTSGAHRSKNYSREEDRALCSAYLNVCKDPSVGANQTIDTYWQRIHDYMYSHFSFEIEHTPGSLAKRWEYIQRDVSRFCGCKNEQERLDASGKTEKDRLEDALLEYEELYKDRFKYLHCWEILKSQNKWLEEISKKAKSKGQGDEVLPIDVEDSLGSSSSGPERPIGRDSAKKRRSFSAAAGSATSSAIEVMQQMNQNREMKMKIESAWAEDFKASNERLIAIKERELELQLKAREDRIMLEKHTDLDEFQRKYLRAQRKKIVRAHESDPDYNSDN